MIYNMPRGKWRELAIMLKNSGINVEGTSRFNVDNWLSSEYGLVALNEYNIKFYQYRATDDAKFLEFILRYS